MGGIVRQRVRIDGALADEEIRRLGHTPANVSASGQPIKLREVGDKLAFARRGEGRLSPGIDSMLVAMAQGDWAVCALCRLRDDVSPTQLAAHAAMASEMFLAAVRPRW